MGIQTNKLATKFLIVHFQTVWATKDKPDIPWTGALHIQIHVFPVGDSTSPCLVPWLIYSFFVATKIVY